MIRVDCRKTADWLKLTLEALRHQGVCVVTGVLSEELLTRLRAGLYLAQQEVQNEVGLDRLARAGELGVIRVPMKYDPCFYELLELSELLEVVDATVSSTAILHLQNGFVLPSFPPNETPEVFQNRFHMDFPRVLNGYLMSVNLFFAIDAFTAQNGATLVVPGTHQRLDRPDPAYMATAAQSVECPAGSMLVFDSTLWHAAGANVSGADRLAINLQFTRSYIKQQFDYVRALGEEVILQQKPRTQQLLGWYTRVVTSLDEYYRPADQRLYRGGQG